MERHETLARTLKEAERYADGGSVDDGQPDPYEQQITNIEQQFQPQQQQRQPSMGEQMLRFNQQWGGGPGGVSQRFASPSPYNIAMGADELKATGDQLDEIFSQAAHQAKDREGNG